MTRYTVTVFINVDEAYHFMALKPTDKLAEVGQFVIDADDLLVAAEGMFAVGNKVAVDAAGKAYPSDVRSVSVGDLIKVVTGREQTFFACASVGWTEVPEPTNPVVSAVAGVDPDSDLTESDLYDLAAEAERGYDPKDIGPAPKRAQGAARYRVISEPHGLVWSGDDAEQAEQVALIAAVNTARTVYLQDGTECD